MIRKSVCIILSLLIIPLSSCRSGQNVSADGSTSMNKVIGLLSEAFENQTGISVTVNASGSGAGLQAVMDGRCEIGLSSRALTDSELAKGLTAHILAYDGIALIVHPDNPIENLTLLDIKNIFTGEITTWDAFGGSESPIVLIGRESGSGTRDGFEQATNTQGQCRYRQELTSSGDVITAVARNVNAIGYTSLASVKDRTKILTVNGVSPNETTIGDGGYPIRRPFILVTSNKHPLSENATRFISYVSSDEAKPLIRRSGVFPAL